MKRFVYIVVFALFLISCKKMDCDINILTDDVQIYDVAMRFNSDHEQKVHVNLIKTNNKTIFDLYEEQKIKNIDLIIGSYNIVNNNNLNDFKLFTVNNDYTLFDSYTNRSFLGNFGRLRPYSLDFNVLVTLKETKVPNKNNVVNVADLKAFITDNLKQEKLIYSTILSPFCELEYIFMFGGALQQVENGIRFDSTRNREIYNSYLTFDKNFNGSEEKRDTILERYVNIPRDCYLKQKIILFDVMPISKALKIPQDKYTIYFLDKTICTTFARQMIALTKNNVNQELSQEFVNFLLSKPTQTKMFNQTMSPNFCELDIHVPTTIDATDDATNDYLNLNPNYYQNIKKICSQINDPHFITFEIYQKFMTSYRFTKSVIRNGQIDKSEFLTHITENLNKAPEK